MQYANEDRIRTTTIHKYNQLDSTSNYLDTCFASNLEINNKSHAFVKLNDNNGERSWICLSSSSPSSTHNCKPQKVALNWKK